MGVYDFLNGPSSEPAPRESYTPASGGDKAASFAEQYGGIAAKIGERLDVDPKLVLAQLALETGYGKSVIPGTNNLGNIKDFSGKGVSATDNMTGSRDKYHKFDTLDDFADHYVGLMGRKYPNMAGSGSDAEAFTSALQDGKYRYAEDQQYANKIKGIHAKFGGVSMPNQEQSGGAYDFLNDAANPPSTSRPFELRIAGDQAVKDVAKLNANNRSMGDVVKDTALDLTSGVLDIGKSAYGLANLATGGYLDPASRSVTKLADQAVTSVMNALTGNKTETSGETGTIAQGFNQLGDSIGRQQSAGIRNQQAERSTAINNADGFWNETKAAIANTTPSLLLGDVARSAPSILMPGAAASAAAKRYGPQIAEQAIAKALAGGATQAEALAIGEKAVANIAERAVNYTTAVGQVGAGVNVDTINKVMDTSDAALAKNPEYLQMIAQGMSRTDALSELSRKAGWIGAAVSAPISFAASKLSGGGAQLAKVATGKYEGSGAKALAGAMGKEFLQEYPESGGEHLGQNVGDKLYGDTGSDLWKGVPAAAIQGGMAGLAMGAGEHFIGGSHRNDKPYAEAAPEAAIAAPLALTNNPDPYISFPDGTVGKRADMEAYINGLPEEQRIAARAKFMGMGEQKITPADILDTQTPEAAIAAFRRSTAADPNAMDALQRAAGLAQESRQIALPEQAAPAQNLISPVRALFDAQLAALRKRNAGELLTSTEAAIADMPLQQANPDAKLAVEQSRARPQTALQQEITRLQQTKESDNVPNQNAPDISINDGSIGRTGNAGRLQSDNGPGLGGNTGHAGTVATGQSADTASGATVATDVSRSDRAANQQPALKETAHVPTPATVQQEKTIAQSKEAAQETVDIKDVYGRTHKVRQSDLEGNADRIPTIRKNGEIVSGEEIPRQIIRESAPKEKLTPLQAEVAKAKQGRKIQAQAAQSASPTGSIGTRPVAVASSPATNASAENNSPLQKSQSQAVPAASERLAMPDQASVGQAQQGRIERQVEQLASQDGSFDAHPAASRRKDLAGSANQIQPGLSSDNQSSQSPSSPPVESVKPNTTANIGKEVSRYAGQYGKGMTEFNAKQEARKRSLATPSQSFAIEEAPQYGGDRYEVVGREKENDSVPSSKTEPTGTPSAQAESILDAANITGSERIAALKDIKKGDITVDELARAHPAKDGKVMGNVNEKPIQEDALSAISKISDAFMLPASKETTVEGITQDMNSAIGDDITVRKNTNIPGETRYQFDLPDGSMARMMVRPFNKYGNSIYGYELHDGEMTSRDSDRPGKNAEEVHGKDDVWIDVSMLNPGSRYGTMIYNIAANYAHNTDKVFIGDPAGMTNESLRRRPEQMLSSALKFGTTEHLAPHPAQIGGKRSAGIGPLDWVYGDHAGNINKLIDLNIKNIDNQGGNGGIEYDASAGRFTDSDGESLTRRDIFEMGKVGLGREANAGGTTLARYALLKSALQGEGGQGRNANGRSNAVLESLVEQLRNHVPAVDQGSGELKEIFYNRDSGPVASAFDQSLHDDIATGADAKSVLERIARESDSEQNRAIAKQLLANNPTATISTGNADGKDFSVDRAQADFVASYSPEDNHVTLFQPANSERNALHELVHAATVQAIAKGGAAAKQMQALYDSVKKSEKLDGRYGMENLDEFVAEAHSNPSFQAALKELPGTGPYKTMWDRFVEMVRNIIGLPAKERNALSEALSVGKDLMAENGKVDGGSGKVLGNLKSLGDLTAHQEAAARSVIGKPKTVIERAKEFKTEWKKNLVQGVFDQFAPLKELSQKAYIQARMSKGGDSSLEALMLYGKVFVDKDGYYDVAYDKTKGHEGFAQAMSKMNGEQDRLFLWVAAQRAEKLAALGLENLFSAAHIKSLKTLNQGTMKDGTKREAVYAQGMKDLNDFNDSVMKIAVDSGLIDDATRQMYKDTPYVPFYRLQEDGVAGFGVKAGMVNQAAWKKLKGGTAQLNDDLMANTLQNWSHLITASAKNRAAKSSLDAAVLVGVAQQVPNSTPGKGLVSYRENGKDKTFMVNDDHVMDAILGLESASLGAWAKPFITMKRWLTVGVTANPAFKIRNLIRDSLQSIGTADLSYNPLTNVRKGWDATAYDSETRARMLAGGGMIRFGSMLDGNSAKHARDLVNQGVDPKNILDSKNKAETFWRQTVVRAYDAYQELGDRGEQVNRAALYEKLVAQGMDHGEANFWARDLMDFSGSGKWAAVRTLTQVVPFMNARLQGLYKLGTVWTSGDHKRLGYTVASLATASIALMLIYKDDDDWKKRSDADRQNYWWFKVGDTAMRIPKPFELGAIATIAEQGVEMFATDDMTGKRFAGNLRDIVLNQLAMNPIPQLVKPMLDVYANKDSFTKRPIESQAMQRLQAKDRYDNNTSEAARFLGGLGLPDPMMALMGHYDELSPVKIDALTRGYFSWLGIMTNTAMDFGIRPMMDRGEKPAMQLKDVFLAGNFVEGLPSNSSRYVSEMYDQAKKVEQAYASYHQAIKSGDTQKAQDILADNRKEIGQYKSIETIKRAESKINAMINQVTDSKAFSAQTKRNMIDMLNRQRDQIARQLVN